MSTLTGQSKSTSYCRRCGTYHSGAWRSFCPDCGLLLIPAPPKTANGDVIRKAYSNPKGGPEFDAP
jgi:hypothetical protein